jgi:hypothetical protein
MAETARPMTDREREDLAEKIRALRTYNRPEIEAILSLIWTVPVCGLAFWIYLGVLRTFGVLARHAHWYENETAVWSAALFTIAILGLLALSVLRGFSFRRREIARTESDLSLGVVIEDAVEVKVVKCFVEQEHFGRIYFLRLHDDRVFTIFDYESPNMEGGGRSRPTRLRFATNMKILRFPASGDVTYEFSGTPIRKPRALPLKAHPDSWPEPEAFCDIPWNDLEKTLAS